MAPNVSKRIVQVDGGRPGIGAARQLAGAPPEPAVSPWPEPVTPAPKAAVVRVGMVTPADAAAQDAAGAPRRQAQAAGAQTPPDAALRMGDAAATMLAAGKLKESAAWVTWAVDADGGDPAGAAED